MSTRCEAAALDAAVYGSWDDAVPPCDELGEVAIPAGDATYLLCGGCAAALDALRAYGQAAMRGALVVRLRGGSVHVRPAFPTAARRAALHALVVLAAAAVLAAAVAVALS